MIDRRARGAVFTPHAVADRLAMAALDGRPPPRAVCDPAAGDGRLLAAVAARCPLGHDSLFGADLDGTAWRDGPLAGTPTRFRVVDSLGSRELTWPGQPVDGFDLVIGNPPFRNQLEVATSLGPGERAAARNRFGSVARGYADTAAMFLVAACEIASAHGRVAFIMPLSFLAARDAAPARRRVLELAALDGVWIAPARVFPDADVRVCALILDRDGPRRRSVRRWVGAEFAPIESVEVDSDELIDAPTWSHLVAAAFDVPEVDLGGDGALGQLVTTTAGFRDQFYGLAPLVIEDGGDRPSTRLAPLITCGLIDPGSAAWGIRATRLAGTRFMRPAVDLDRLDAGSPLGRWVAARRQPKLLIATQTRVVEAAPDPTGGSIPSTPVIAAHGTAEALWRALAVLLAPPVTAWVRMRYSGAALSADAIKLSARQVCEIPLPADRGAWATAADLLRRAHQGTDGHIGIEAVIEAGTHMTAAYRCDNGVTEWWVDRLPRRR